VQKEANEKSFDDAAAPNLHFTGTLDAADLHTKTLWIDSSLYSASTLPIVSDCETHTTNELFFSPGKRSRTCALKRSSFSLCLVR
jgi:hypothetical protein